MTVLVTGGAGFIGSAVCRLLIEKGGYRVVNVDKLTYAGRMESLRDIENHPDYSFHQLDICNQPAIQRLLEQYQPSAIMHLAAESHVDRSIDGPEAFIQTNIVGTYRLLSASLDYWRTLSRRERENFRFHHVSTDEVFGDLPFEDGKFTEQTPYAPSSPYSASKASSDHLVRAWFATYGLPVVISNCSNNFGPFQFPEKLIPLVTLNALHGKPLPIYGMGQNVRDWLYVDDHAAALEAVLQRGRLGESYNIGASCERSNLQVVETICVCLDELRPMAGPTCHADLIEFVADRPGHDRRYAINADKILSEIGWQPAISFEEGIRRTLEWYLQNEWWWTPLYQSQRLGIAKS